MRTFIVPTDFSQNAEHAAAYAVQLARQLKARIILMHAYEAPVAISEYEISTLHFETMRDHIFAKLEDSKRTLQEQFGNEVPIETKAFSNDLIGHIKELYEDPEARLVVIGLTGSGMAHFFLGSNTLNIVNEVDRIILTVPPHARFRPIRKVVLACDMRQVENTVPADRIRRILTLLDAELRVLNIQKPGAHSPETETERLTLERMLEGIPFSFHAMEEGNIVTGIKDFASQERADLIAIIPRRRDFLEKLLRPSHTKAMLFKSGIPILTLPPEGQSGAAPHR